jgi:hypothetical protein
MFPSIVALLLTLHQQMSFSLEAKIPGEKSFWSGRQRAPPVLMEPYIFAAMDVYGSNASF